MTRTRFLLATLAMTVAVAVASQVAVAGTVNNLLQVMPVNADGGYYTPQPWTVDSNACIAAAVSAATGGEDGGRMKSADGGVAVSGRLYRCFNPSGSVGDICLRNSSTTPFTCSATALSMQLAPGGVEWTMLVDPVMVSSSSGAASLVCCPLAN